MERISFSQHQDFWLDGERVSVVRHLNPNRVQLEESHTGEITTHHEDELLEMYVQGRLVAEDPNVEPIAQIKTPPGDISQFPQRDQERGMFVRDVITIARRIAGVKLTRALIREFYEDIKLAVKKSLGEAAITVSGSFPIPAAETIYKQDLALRNAHGDATVLVPAHRNKGRHGSRVTPSAEELMDRLIRDRYLTRARMTMRHVYDLLCAEIRRHNLAVEPNARITPPHLATFRRRIRAYSAFEICRLREGSEIAARRFRHRGVGEATTRIGQRYETDHWESDLILIDGKSRIPLGRAWLTVIIDVYSRMPVGYYLGFNPPSAYSVLRALKSAILPKQSLLRRYKKVRGAWPCWGVCEELVCDNGMELHSESLRRACMELGITLTWCGARDPQGKGTVERFFRTLATQLVHLLPGTTRSNPKQRGEVDSTKEARMNLDEFEEVLLKYLVDVYMCQSHGGLHDTPRRIWEESAKLHPPVLPADAERLKRSLSITRQANLTERGVVIEGLQYTSSELTRLRANSSIRRGHSPEVIVKFDPDDLRQIEVALKGGRYIKVPNARPEYADGLTLVQHRAIRAHNRARGRELNSSSLLESKIELQAMVDALHDKRRPGKRGSIPRALKDFVKTALAASAPAGAGGPNRVSEDKVLQTYLSKTCRDAHEQARDEVYEVSFSSPRRTRGGARDSAGGLQ